MFIGNKTEERRCFSIDEKQQMLKKSNFKCACCGTKLTTETISCEHVLPLSRGGTNDIINMVALCKICNIKKRNMLYLPTDYYINLNKHDMTELEVYFYSWFRSIKESFDFNKYPFVTPCLRIPMYSKIGKKTYLVGQYDLHYCTNRLRVEVEAVTNIQLDGKPYYILKSVKDDKLIALLRVDKDDTILDIYVVWSCASTLNIANVISRLVLSQIQLNIAIEGDISAIRYMMDDKSFYKYCHMYKFLYDGFIETFSMLSGENFSGVQLILKLIRLITK